jgi:uncharacterized protein YbbC (DUF1343 family)
MKQHLGILLLLSTILLLPACFSRSRGIKTGAEHTEEYIPLIKGKNIALVANQTSIVKNIHLADTLLSLGINIKVIFAPEHGFRNMADAGETITDGKDQVTGIPLISLYGSHLKPTASDLQGLDYIIFDIQDVGARFYTYISTMHYVMEACAENNVKLIILDRPNPNGFYFDGPVLDTAFSSFVGMDPVPVVHGMTIGEYAKMINGEGWLKNGVSCDLTVIRCSDYNHEKYYELPVKPSPNLPNQTSVYLYPSICFFEGTPLSCGRGTDFPFQLFGDPNMPDEGFSFTPRSLPGATDPPCLGLKCYGTDLHNAIKDGIVPSHGLNLSWIINSYNKYPVKEKFFTPYFDVLAGGPVLKEQIQMGMTEKEIKASWKGDLEKFGRVRAKYLLY